MLVLFIMISMRKFAPMGVTLRSATEPFDTSTSIGTFLFQLLGSLAELEKATIIERTTLGRDRVARGGRWTGGVVPLGYDLDTQGCLVPNTRLIKELGMTEAELVHDLFQRIAHGGTAIAECHRLNALGVMTARCYGNGKVVHVGALWRPSRLKTTSLTSPANSLRRRLNCTGEICQSVTVRPSSVVPAARHVPSLWRIASVQFVSDEPV